MKRLLCGVSVLFVMLGWSSANAFGQGFPTKVVRIIVAYPPGGALDLVARAMASKLAESFGQPVLVENRPGAGGNLGAGLVAKSAPDGHTLLLTPLSLAISPIFYRELPFDPAKDFAAVTQIVESRQILVSSPHVPASSVKEFVALAKAKPGALNYGTTGGSAPYLSMEILKSAAGIDVLAIPYKGEQHIVQALLSKDVDVAVLPISSSLLRYLTEGRLRALGLTSAKRSPSFSHIPAISEFVPGFEVGSWQGLFVSANTPRAIVDQLSYATVKACESPEVRKHVLAGAGGGREMVCSTADEFQAVFRADLAKFQRIAKEVNIPFMD